MEINLIRKSGKFNFEASNEAGFTVELDAKPAIGGEGKGFRPMETLLVGLGGCSGIDVVNVLTKQKEPLDDIKISIKATRRNEERNYYLVSTVCDFAYVSAALSRRMTFPPHMFAISCSE